MRPPPSTTDEEDDASKAEENKLINEVFGPHPANFNYRIFICACQEYKVWKKNAPYLYDVVLTHALTWPTLTCQWLPDKQDSPNLPYTTHRLLFGTHTSGQAQDYLQFATLQLPKRDAESLGLDRADYDPERGELGGYKGSPAKITITQKINHPGEVNRARYMPQNPDLIATKTVKGEILVFDRTKHSDEPDKPGVFKPDITLAGQTKEGFGLAWNPSRMGEILGASEDATVCLWDVNSYSKANTTIHPLTTFRGHGSVVGDVDWHATQENVLASVGDDRMLLIWDKRAPTAVTQQVEAHEAEILSIAFSLASEHLVVTGSSDRTCGLWDIRNLATKLHSFESHTHDVLHLAWSPHSPTVFASASSDRRINIWDLSLIGQEQTPDDAEDGPPELLFVHGGHTAPPTDFCWAPGESETWTLASSAEDNIAMVWSPSMRIWAGEEVEVDPKQLENSGFRK